jgi:hypothetical protein
LQFNNFFVGVLLDCGLSVLDCVCSAISDSGVFLDCGLSVLDCVCSAISDSGVFLGFDFALT